MQTGEALGLLGGPPEAPWESVSTRRAKPGQSAGPRSSCPLRPVPHCAPRPGGRARPSGGATAPAAVWPQDGAEEWRWLSGPRGSGAAACGLPAAPFPLSAFPGCGAAQRHLQEQRPSSLVEEDSWRGHPQTAGVRTVSAHRQHQAHRDPRSLWHRLPRPRGERTTFSEGRCRRGESRALGWPLGLEAPASRALSLCRKG